MLDNNSVMESALTFFRPECEIFLDFVKLSKARLLVVHDANRRSVKLESLTPKQYADELAKPNDISTPLSTYKYQYAPLCS